LGGSALSENIALASPGYDPDGLFYIWLYEQGDLTATGIFADVPVGSFAADLIEQLYNEAITGGCATSPLRYCPNDTVTRGAMAVFLANSFFAGQIAGPSATSSRPADVKRAIETP
jgi:hypothetical protein